MTGEIPIPIPDDVLAEFERQDRIKRLLVSDDDDVREAMGQVWRLRNWCHEAQHLHASPTQEQRLEDPPGVPPLKWPTGVGRLDDRTGGGAYGFTCLAGAPKTGKSMLALSMGIEAANEDWRVWYYNAELSRYAIANRIRSYCGGEPPWQLINHFTMLHTERGISVPHLLERLEEKLSLDDRCWLIIVDSINRIVSQSDKVMGSENAYWRTLEDWSEFFRMAAKLSEGRVAAVVVSELNASGGVKGRGLEYAADLVVKLDRVVTVDESYVLMSVPYARSSGGGPLGKFHLDWRTGRFVYVGDG